MLTLPIDQLSAGRTLQTFNLATKQKLSSYMTDEDVVYWKWINDTQIGLVMDRSVAHWDAMGSGSAPTKVFDRHATLEGAQIINYRASGDGQWLVLVGILPDNTPGAFRIKGAMQLYSVARRVSQPIEGHAAAFSTIRLENAPEDTNLFSFAVRTATGAKVRTRFASFAPASFSLSFPRSCRRPAAHRRDRPQCGQPGLPEKGH